MKLSFIFSFWLQNQDFCELSVCPSSGEIIGVTWMEGQMPPTSIFILPKNSFWLLSQIQAHKRIEVRLGGKGCMYIKDRFKTIFPSFYFDS